MSPDPVRHADTIIFPASLDPQAVSVVRRLREAGYESYLVGGCVRDLLLGHIPKDFDASTEARPRQIRRVFRNCRVIGRRFKLAHVHFGSHIIEVATFRKNPTEAGSATTIDSEAPPADSTGSEEATSGEAVAEPEVDSSDSDADLDIDADDLLITRDNVYGTSEEDTLRRDFTINALLYDVLTDEVIDYVGGVKDVENKILRTIGNPMVRIAEDPVRMLRAVKFTARLGLTMDPALDSAMHASAELIDRSAPPRVLEEIFKMLTCGTAGRALELLLKYGLLERLLPEVAGYWEQRPEECIRLGNALDHVDQAKRRVSNAFVLALLFHDVWRDALDGEERMDPLVAARELIAPAALRMNIPRRDVSTMTQLLLNQSRLERSRKGRRFRMADFLARDTTVQALDLLYVRSMAGLADPEVHARWAMRLAEHHGSDAVPGAPRTTRASGSTEGDATKKRRRRGGRRRSGARRPTGRSEGESPRSEGAEEGSSSSRAPRRRQEGRGSGRSGDARAGSGQDDNKPRTDSAEKSGSTRDRSSERSRPPRKRRETGSASEPGAAASKPAASTTADKTGTKNGPAPARQAGPGKSESPASNEATSSGFTGRLKGLFRRVLGRSSSGSSVKPKSNAAKPASSEQARDKQAGARAAPASSAQRRTAGSSASTSSPDEREKGRQSARGSERGARDGTGDQSGDGGSTGSRSQRPKRRRRRRSGSGDGGSEGGSESNSTAAADGSASGEGSDTADSKSTGGRRRSRGRGASDSSGGSRKKTAGRSRSGRGNRSEGGNRSKSSRSKTKAAGSASSEEKSKDSSSDPSGRHPEDIEDMFDW